MTLAEAFECGKMVRHPAAPDRTAVRVCRSLRWLDKGGMADTYVTVDYGMLDGWELVPVSVPERYEFVKALMMMRQGKWMRPVGTRDWFSRDLRAWLCINEDGNVQPTPAISLATTDSIWEKLP